MHDILKGKHVVTNTQENCNSINALQAFILCPARKNIYIMLSHTKLQTSVPQGIIHVFLLMNTVNLHDYDISFLTEGRYDTEYC
jgi:hypothetical protein